MSERPRAAFLDRDGTLMEDRAFIGDPRRVKVLDGAAEALRRLADAGYQRIVVTNQSGVARGFFAELDVEKVNEELARQLALEGASIDAVYACPHLEGCDCRKPLPGLVQRAVRERRLNLGESVVFGDRSPDIELARNLGIPGVLINAREPYEGPEPALRAHTLLEGVERFLEHARVIG